MTVKESSGSERKRKMSSEKSQMDWVEESRGLGLPEDFCLNGLKAVRISTAQEGEYGWDAQLPTSVEGRKILLQNWASI